MDNNFEVLSKKEENQLSIEELCQYYKKLRKHNLVNKDETKSMKFKKAIHPFLLSLITLKRIISGQKLHIINGKVDDSTKPIIFAISHIGKFDIEIVSEAIKKHYYLLSGDPEYMYRTLDGKFLDWNGVVYVDTEDKEDRLVAKETTIKILNQGGNLMWFPEGIWNLSPNMIVLPCYFGIIEAALKTHAAIIPVSIEQMDKDFYVNIGKKILVNNYRSRYNNDKDIKLKAIKDLRDMMATLKWEIWEQMPIASRNDLIPNYFEQFIEKRIQEWPFFTIDTINNRVFKDSSISEPEEVFDHLNNIEINRGNAFLLRNK